jgi:hypothetical protein
VPADLPTFLTTAAPRGVIERPERSADTLRWYLWVAFTQAPPHPIERAFIDRQVDEFSDYMEKTINDLSEGRDLPLLGTPYVAQFRERYRLLRDNRLVPYFKQVYLENDWFRVDGCKPEIADYVKLLRSDLDRNPGARTGAALSRRMRVMHELNARHVEEELLGALLGFQPAPAALRQLPSRTVTGYGLGANPAGYWTFRINKTQPFPALGDTRFIYWVTPPEGP